MGRAPGAVHLPGRLLGGDYVCAAGGWLGRRILDQGGNGGVNAAPSALGASRVSTLCLAVCPRSLHTMPSSGPPPPALSHALPPRPRTVSLPPSAQAGRDVEQLASQLLAVNENAFRGRSASLSVYSSRGTTLDWKIATVPKAAAARPAGACLGDVGGACIARHSFARASARRCRSMFVAPSPRPVGQTCLARPPPKLCLAADQEGEGDAGAWTGSGDAAPAPSEGDEGSEGGGAGQLSDDIDVAPAGRLPFMEAALDVSTPRAAPKPPRKEEQPGQEAAGPPAAAEAGGEGEGEGDDGLPIARLDLSSLEAYAGVPGAVTLRPTSKQLPSVAMAAGAGALWPERRGEEGGG
jgi:hypothetical protein